MNLAKPLPGLPSNEAALRLRQRGPNELPGDGGRTFARLALDVLREPMFLLLLACGLLYWLLGDRQEAFILLGFVFFIMAITIAQDWKTESRNGSPDAKSSKATGSSFPRETGFRRTPVSSPRATWRWTNPS